MLKVLCLSLALALSSVARADDIREASYGQVADLATTAAALALGASEANPLGLLVIGAKYVAVKRIAAMPAVEQPQAWGILSATGWGASANNLCVVGSILTGGVSWPVCPLVGLLSGSIVWRSGREERERATFDAICAEQRIANPGLVCVYTKPME